MRSLAGFLFALFLAVSIMPRSEPAAPASASPQPATPMLDGVPMTACVVHGDVPVVADAPAYCGTLDVAENRSIADGRTIPLRVAVIPADRATGERNPLFLLAGGPGDVGTEFFAWFPDVYGDIHAGRDIVLFDQRGTGASNAVIVPPAPDTTGMTFDQADAAWADWAVDGFYSSVADAQWYSSTESAEDVDALRAALGYRQIDLYGPSYGGTLAQYYLRRHPDRVGAAVLDGATPVDVPVLEEVAHNSELALEALFARCTNDPACHTAFPDLDAEWATLRSQLSQGIETTVVDPTTGEHAIVSLVDVAPSLHQALLTEATAAAIPLAIHLASEGQWEAAGRLVPGVSSGGGETLLMSDATRCSEPWAWFDPDAIAALGYGSYAVDWQVALAQRWGQMCRYVPEVRSVPADGSPLKTDVPIAWLAATADPQDPPANLTRIPGQQPHSTIVVVPAQQHVVGHLGCGPVRIAAFLDAPTQRQDWSCMEQRVPGIPFVLQ